MIETLTWVFGIAMRWINNLIRRKEASAEDLARALKHERTSDEADADLAADDRDVNDKLRDLGGIRKP